MKGEGTISISIYNSRVICKCYKGARAAVEREIKSAGLCSSAQSWIREDERRTLPAMTAARQQVLIGIVVVLYSPRPPSHRLSFSLQCIHSIRTACFFFFFFFLHSCFPSHPLLFFPCCRIRGIRHFSFLWAGRNCTALARRCLLEAGLLLAGCRRRLSGAEVEHADQYILQQQVSHICPSYSLSLSPQKRRLCCCVVSTSFLPLSLSLLPSNRLENDITQLYAHCLYRLPAYRPYTIIMRIWLLIDSKPMYSSYFIRLRKRS